MAAIVTSHISYFILAFLPPILWLLFYFREDRHPEPKLYLFFTFLGGMAAAFFSVLPECFFANLIGAGSCTGGIEYAASPFIIFLGIALIEEYMKYLPVRLFILKHSVFSEPEDAMIYMMTAAMGFAALENALFIAPFFFDVAEGALLTLPLSSASLLSGLDVATNRFLGANFLHVLTSGIVGYFIARGWCLTRRHYMTFAGIIVATVLHAAFNYLILVREVIPEGTLYLIVLLSTMAVMVFVEFSRLRRASNTCIPAA